MRKVVCLLVACLSALVSIWPCEAQRQPVAVRPPDLRDGTTDGRVSWESPYFLVRKIPGKDYWAFVFKGIGARAPFPFLLTESSRDPTAIVVESPKKDFRIRMLANRAIVTFPGSDKLLKRGKGECGGLWFLEGVALKPVTRTWHPKESNEVSAKVCLPTSLGSEELQRQLEEPGTLKTILVGESPAQANVLSISDLPAGEREAATLDLGVANAPRWILKVFGKPVKTGRETWLYQEDPLLSKELMGLLPPEWHKLREAAQENAVFGFMAGQVKDAMGHSKVALGAANMAVQKHAVLKKPLDELDVDSLAQLIETVLTKLDDRLTKAALGIIGVGGDNPRVAALDQAVKNGDAREMVLAWSNFSEVERDAFVAVSTQPIFGRLRCPQSKLTHIDLLSKACEVAIEIGPTVFEECAAKQKQAGDDLLRQQLQALAGGK